MFQWLESVNAGVWWYQSTKYYTRYLGIFFFRCLAGANNHRVTQHWCVSDLDACRPVIRARLLRILLLLFCVGLIIICYYSSGADRNRIALCDYYIVYPHSIIIMQYAFKCEYYVIYPFWRSSLPFLAAISFILNFVIKPCLVFTAIASKYTSVADITKKPVSTMYHYSPALIPPFYAGVGAMCLPSISIRRLYAY